MGTAKRKKGEHLGAKSAREHEVPPTTERALDDWSLLPKTERQFREMSARFETWNGAVKVWEDVFSDADRTKLGNKLEDAWREYVGTVGMAAAAWRCDREEALVRLCEECSSLDPATLRRMRRDKNLGIPIKPPSRGKSPKPKWHRDAGELEFDGQLVREIASRTKAKNVVAILDAFELERWPVRIDSPLPPGKGSRPGAKGDAHKLRETIQTLNTGLSRIRFYADGTGTGITWKAVTAAHPPRNVVGRRRTQSR